MGRGALEHHVLRQTRGRCAVAWSEERVVRLWAGRYASGHAEWVQQQHTMFLWNKFMKTN